MDKGFGAGFIVPHCSFHGEIFTSPLFSFLLLNFVLFLEIAGAEGYEKGQGNECDQDT